jgi:hypothetical protein
LVILAFVILMVMKAKEKTLEEIDSAIYDTVYEKDAVSQSNKKAQR